MLAPSRRITRNTGLTAAALACTTTTAHAVITDCSASTAFECTLDRILHFLDAAAWVLAVLLVAVIIVAIRYYRSHARESTSGRRRS